MKDYKAYIFDMDLTLLNTLISSKKSYEYAYKKMGLVFDEFSLTHHLSISLSETYYELDNPCGTREQFIEYFRECAAETFAEDSFFYEDGIALIQELKKKGKIIGIVTNREYENVMNMISKDQRMQGVVSSIITCDKVKFLKPDPEPIKKCLEELHLEPSEAVYIGDAKNDMVASERANVDFICVERYNNCTFECETIVHDLREII